MPNMLIRDLDEATHAELKRRAAEAGTSLQSYVAGLLGNHVRQPTMDEWLRRLDALPRIDEVFGADAVEAAREDSP